MDFENQKTQPQPPIPSQAAEPVMSGLQEL